MRIWLFCLIVLVSCTKKVGVRKEGVIPTVQSVPQPTSCNITANTTISYSATILPLFTNNCLVSSCHVTPGGGGFNLDSYQGISAACLSGAVMPVVVNTDTNSPIMPIPPRRHLDSCELRSIQRWIDQGAPNN